MERAINVAEDHWGVFQAAIEIIYAPIRKRAIAEGRDASVLPGTPCGLAEGYYVRADYLLKLRNIFASGVRTCNESDLSEDDRIGLAGVEFAVRILQKSYWQCCSCFSYTDNGQTACSGCGMTAKEMEN